jgi:hypothetical protein
MHAIDRHEVLELRAVSSDLPHGSVSAAAVNGISILWYP